MIKRLLQEMEGSMLVPILPLGYKGKLVKKIGESKYLKNYKPLSEAMNQKFVSHGRDADGRAYTGQTDKVSIKNKLNDSQIKELHSKLDDVAAFSKDGFLGFNVKGKYLELNFQEDGSADQDDMVALVNKYMDEIVSAGISRTNPKKMPDRGRWGGGGQGITLGRIGIQGLDL